LGLAIGVSLLGTQIAVFATPQYGSTVNVSGLSKYGYAWTSESGQNVRARIVIGGGLSDKNTTGFVQTDQVSSWYTETAYINHYVAGNIIASYTK
jgi:hypothetical protein